LRVERCCSGERSSYPARYKPTFAFSVLPYPQRYRRTLRWAFPVGGTLRAYQVPIVARRQKRKGMQWSVETSDALAALRTLLLNDGWEGYWQEHQPLYLEAA